MVLHGIKKDSMKDEEAQKALQKKAKLYKELLATVLGYKKEHNYRDGPLKHCAALLEINPDVSTAWNYRKMALEARLESATGEERIGLVMNEFTLTEKALQKNPKSYCTWHHRKWLVLRGLSSPDTELYLCDKMLDIDERNFHCWEYRRFLAARMGVSDGDELSFTTKKIEQNFSNYSAWHQRTLLLKRMQEATSAAAESDSSPQAGVHNVALTSEKLDQEYDLVHQAFFTEPEDQSGWFYYLWLFGNTLHHSHLENGYTGNRVEEEIEICREMLQLEPSSKWVLLALARLLATRGASDLTSQAEMYNIYEKLMQIDPMRKLYYMDVKDKHIAFSSI